MNQQTRSHWQCTNRNCSDSRMVTLSEELRGTPVCRCGAAMRKEELSLVFTYLDFLKSDEVLVNTTGREKES